MPFGLEEAAVYAVFVIGTAVSLFAFFYGRRLKSGANISRALREDAAFAGMADRSPIIGNETTVDAPSPKALLDLFAVLVENPIHRGMNSPWAKMSRDPGKILLQRINDNELHLEAENLSIGAVQIQAEAVGSQVRVRWMIEVPGARTFATIGQLWALCLGLPVAVLVPYLVAKYLLSSSNSVMRGQTLQVLQTFQLLWEPYLFVGLAATRMKSASRHMGTLIEQAAYELRTGRQTPDMGSFGARTSIGKT